MDGQARVAVIVVHHADYAQRYLEPCCRSLQRQSYPAHRFRVFLVRNGAADPTGPSITRLAPEARIVELAEQIRTSSQLGNRLKQPFPKPEEFGTVEQELDSILRSLSRDLGHSIKEQNQSPSKSPDPKSYQQHLKEYAEFRTEYAQNYPILAQMEQQPSPELEEAKKFLYLQWSILRLQNAFYTDRLR